MTRIQDEIAFTDTLAPSQERPRTDTVHRGMRGTSRRLGEEKKSMSDSELTRIKVA
jgi:hypothetical protein